MKSTMKVLVFAFVMFTSASFAELPVTMGIIPNTAKGIFKVYYKTEEAGKVKVSIYNKNGEMVFTELMGNTSSFVRPYNFSQLPEDEYTIVLEDKKGKQVEKIVYKQEKVESIINLSRMTGADNKFLLSVSNNGAEAVTVKIYGNDTTLLYNQTELVSGSFGLIYNLNQIKSKGTKVTFEISTASGKVETISY